MMEFDYDVSNKEFENHILMTQTIENRETANSTESWHVYNAI